MQLFSYHSLVGGIGKSTRALAKAEALAASGSKTCLVDLDILGSQYYDRYLNGCVEPLQYISPHQIIYINDWLLMANQDWDESVDKPCELGAKSTLYPEKFRIVMANPLPQEIIKVLHLLDDEAHSAFIESRIEWFLAHLIDDGFDAVVFDCPTGIIHGVGRSILSLLLRLSEEPKQELAEDGGTPLALMDTKIESYPCLLARRTEKRACKRLTEAFKINLPVEFVE